MTESAASLCSLTLRAEGRHAQEVTRRSRRTRAGTRAGTRGSRVGPVERFVVAQSDYEHDVC